MLINICRLVSFLKVFLNPYMETLAKNSYHFSLFKFKLVTVFLSAKNSVHCETHLVATAGANLCSRLFYSKHCFNHRRATTANCQRFPPHIYPDAHKASNRAG